MTAGRGIGAGAQTGTEAGMEAGEGARLRALVARLAAMGPVDRRRAIRRLSDGERRTFLEEWAGWSHAGQTPPVKDWRVWLIRAGRGFGKTRAGAEWVAALARRTPDARIALVGGTTDEARRVMVEGESGLLNVQAAGDGCVWRRDAGELRWASGACAFVYSAEAPDSLRGPQHHVAWCDEIAKWRYGEAAWDNLLLGLRLGDDPRAVVTTTPRPNDLMRRVMAMKGTVQTVGRTRDNLHLPRAFVDAVEDQYGGTRLGRQELDGEMIDEVAGALWTRDVVEAHRVDAAPELVRVVVGVDPPATAEGDACGIVGVGLGADGRGYVLEDASVSGLPPEGWAAAVAACARRLEADLVVAERNQGGDMVGSVLQAADERLPFRLAHASRAKVARAEPVSTLYRRGKVSHLRGMAALEDELCGLQAAGGYAGPGRSPDRADALVWALSELMLGRRGQVGVRGL